MRPSLNLFWGRQLGTRLSILRKSWLSPQGRRRCHGWRCLCRNRSSKGLGQSIHATRRGTDLRSNRCTDLWAALQSTTGSDEGDRDDHRRTGGDFHLFLFMDRSRGWGGAVHPLFRCCGEIRIHFGRETGWGQYEAARQWRHQFKGLDGEHGWTGNCHYIQNKDSSVILRVLTLWRFQMLPWIYQNLWALSIFPLQSSSNIFQYLPIMTARAWGV